MEIINTELQKYYSDHAVKTHIKYIEQCNIDIDSLSKDSIKYIINSMIPPNTAIVCVSEITNKRDYMEDTHKYIFGEYCKIYGVFDGHGGDKVSKKLRDEFLEKLNKDITPILKKQSYHPTLMDELKDQICVTFKQFDNYLHKNQEKFNIKTDGSTAVVVIDVLDKLIFCNVGDSRAVLTDTNKNVLFSTKDQKPEGEKERDRIKKAKGVVMYGRVNGILAVARAFGDFDLKLYDYDYSECGAPVSVCPVIDVIDKPKRGYIVLASDGLWDDTSNEYVANNLDTHNCFNFIDYARNRGSADNITVMIVKVV